MQALLQFKTTYFLFGFLLFPIITQAQQFGLSDKGLEFFTNRHLNARVELGIQSDKFYSNIGLQLFLPTSDATENKLDGIFTSHGPYLGISIAFNKTSIRPQIGYQAAFYGFIHTGIDFTLTTDELNKAIICRPKLGLTLFNYLGIHYSQGFATAKINSESAFKQVGLYFMVPIKKNI